MNKATCDHCIVPKAQLLHAFGIFDCKQRPENLQILRNVNFMHYIVFVILVILHIFIRIPSFINHKAILQNLSCILFRFHIEQFKTCSSKFHKLVWNKESHLNEKLAYKKAVFL